VVGHLHFDPPVIAHRGASGYAPENTLSAFIKAAQLGIKWVEFDVMQAWCGEVIVFHDDELNRITTQTGLVTQHPYSYLRTLDAGSWRDLSFSGERIPTLMQTMEVLDSVNMNVNIEIKGLSNQIEKLVLSVLKQMAFYLTHQRSRILFSSFSIEALRLLRQHSAKCQIGLLLHEWLPNWQEICVELNCVSVHVYDKILTHETVRQVKKMNKVLLCYTVNDFERASQLYAWGVDALFSDFPDLILKAHPSYYKR